MVSKGVDYYSFIATDGTSVVFSGPKVGSTTYAANNFTKNHLEIESKNLSWDTFTGTFSWNVIQNGGSLYSRKEDISSLTGNLEGGNLSPLMSTPAIIGSDYTISYGLYDAGSGIAGLPNADQAWVSIVPNLANWMAQVAPVGSDQEKQAFATFVLAAAHDAGMNTMDGINLVTSGKCLAVIIAAFSVLLPIPGFAALLAASPQKIMLDLAMTQKESTTSMLNMGVRYFDFRPAYLLPGVRSLVPSGADTLYHTHLIIPGERFDSFLAEVVAFLKAQPTEFVVVRTCADGIKGCDIPSSTTITQFATNALSGTGIQLGDSSSFQQSIASLRASNTRLILVQNNKKYDSYSDSAYATLNPSTIIAKFKQMNTDDQTGNDFTVLQCQGTAEGITDVLIYGATAANWSTSPLMSTKASFDIQTLPWIIANATNNLKAKQNIMIMNDFIDGATTYTAYQLSLSRFAPPQTVTAGTPQSVLGTAGVANSLSVVEAEAAKTAQEAALSDQRANEALLQTISNSHQAAMNAQGTVSDEDKRAQGILEASWREAEDVKRKQEEVVALAEKRLQAARSRE